MPTNEERRELAARLREPFDIPSEMGTWEGGLMFIEPSRADEADYSQIHKVLLGCLPADLMHPCDYEDLHNRLADLIEPQERTCHNISTVPCKFTCSECHQSWRRANGNGAFAYCPNCGAKVIHDA